MSTPSTSNHAARLAARRAADAMERGGTAAPPTTSTKPKGDRYAALNGFVDVALRDAGGAEAKVWLVLYRDVRGGVARTGMGDIARRAGLSRRGVVKALNALKVRGLVERTSKGTVGGLPNSYRLKVPT